MTSLITFRPGSSRVDRAVFLCGTASVPTAVISKLAKEAAGQSEPRIERLMIARLAAPRYQSESYAAFLDALDRAGITYSQALKLMLEMKKAPGVQKIGSRASFKKEIKSTARVLCRKYGNRSAEEMFEAFLATTQTDAFKEGVIESIKGLEATFGRNASGKIRSRNVPAGSLQRAETARAGRDAKSKKTSKAAGKKAVQPSKKKA